MEQFGNHQEVCQVRVDAAGRVVIPAGLRERHRIVAGEPLVIEDDANGIRLRTMAEVIRDVQARCRKYSEPGVLQSEELIRERHEEAAQESAAEASPRA